MPKKGPKLNPIIRTPDPPQPPSVPADLDKHTSITIGQDIFEIQADDLEVICELGRERETDRKYISFQVQLNIFLRARGLRCCGEDEAQAD